MKCVRCHDKLVHAYHAQLEAWIDEDLFLPSNGCSSKSACAIKKAPAIGNLSLFRMADGIHWSLGPWEGEDLSGFYLCMPCLASIQARYECACEDLWSQLPTFFGLPPWDELKDFDT
jgi:hypothetical protein